MSAATLFATLEDSTVGRTRLLGNAALLQGQYPDGQTEFRSNYIAITSRWQLSWVRKPPSGLQPIVFLAEL